MTSTSTVLLAGTAASFALSQYVAALLYGIQPRDPLTAALSIGTLTLVGAGGRHPRLARRTRGCSSRPAGELTNRRAEPVPELDGGSRPGMTWPRQ